MTLEDPQVPLIDCVRCGYNLRGIADDQPCPECGLLARRSRRVTDELHETSLRWLTSISRGINLILLSLVLSYVLPSLYGQFGTVGWQAKHMFLDISLRFGGFELVTIVGLIGVFMLTRPEGHKLADRVNRKWRIALRVFAFIPTAAMALLGSLEWRDQMNTLSGTFSPKSGQMYVAVAVLISAGSAPLALLLFLHLRAIAKRARIAHLAEHCAIVGIGISASLLLFLPAQILNAPDAAIIVLGFSLFIFALWSLYLLIRIAISFFLAARRLRKSWTADDRALEPQ